MEPLHPHKEPDVDTVERARLIRDVYAAGIALKDYFTKDALCGIFQELNNKSLIVCVHEQGFPSIDALLMYTNKFTSAVIHNKVQYKALEPAEDQATRELFSLVNRQTSKKKKVKPPKVNTVHRQYFDRSKVRSQSFHGRASVCEAGSIKSQIEPQPIIPANLSKLSEELRSRLKFNSLVQSGKSFVRGTTAGIWTPKPDRAASRKSPPCANEGSSNIGLAKTTGSPICTPAAGVQRFVNVLNKHNGVATSDQLKKTYRELYGVDWDATELKRYFGLSSSRDVVKNFLSDLVEITSLRGTGGMRCYRLLHPSAAKPARRPPSMEELYEHLLEIMIDKEPEPVNFENLTLLYKHKYAMELDPQTQFGISWKDLIIHNFSASFCVDARGRLQLNTDNPGIKKKVLEKQVQAALDADLDNDSFDNSSISASSSASLMQFKLNTSCPVNVEQRSDDSVFVDVNRRCRREIYEKPLEGVFTRNMRLTESCRGRVRITTFRDDNESRSIRGRDLAQFNDLPVVHFPAPGPSHPQTSSAKLQKAALSMSLESVSNSGASASLNGAQPVERPGYSSAERRGSSAVERPASSLSTRSSSSSMRARCEKTFASVGTFFKRITEADEIPTYEVRGTGNVVADGYIHHAGFARSNLEKDVSCVHPYFNVHMLSESGDARSQAVRRGLTINQ